MMDGNNGDPPNIDPRPKILENQTPAIFSEIVSNIVPFLEKYGWFIVLGVIIVAAVWSKIEPYWTKWKKKRNEQIEEMCIDPVTLAKTQEAIQISRKKMQEITDAKTAEFAERIMEMDEKKRQEKITDWERHQQGRGYRSKMPKPDTDQKEEDKKVKFKRTTRRRNADYNPLTGSSSGSSFRPASRRNTGGG